MKALISLLLIVSFENARAAEETTLQSVLEELENLKKIISQQQTKIGSLEEKNRKLQEEVVHLKSDQEVIREKMNLQQTIVPNRSKNVIWTVCLRFFCPSREFFTHMETLFAGEVLQILTYTRHLRLLSSEGSLACDTVRPFKVDLRRQGHGTLIRGKRFKIQTWPRWLECGSSGVRITAATDLSC